MDQNPIQITLKLKQQGKTQSFICQDLIWNSQIHSNYYLVTQIIDNLNGAQFGLEHCIGLWGSINILFLNTQQHLTLQGSITAYRASAYQSQYQRLIRLILRAEISTLFHNCRTGVYYGAQLQDVIDKGLNQCTQNAHLNQHTQIKSRWRDKADNRYPTHPMLTQYLESDADFISRTIKQHGAWFNFYQMLDSSDETPVSLVIADNNDAFQYQSTPIPLLAKAQSDTAGLYHYQPYHQLNASQGVEVYDYEEASGETTKKSFPLRKGEALRTSLTTRTPFIQLTNKQFHCYAKTVQESLLSQQSAFHAKFQGLSLQAGTCITLNTKKDLQHLLTRVRYHFCSQKSPHSDSIHYRQNHQMWGVMLTQEVGAIEPTPYRLPLIGKRAEQIPRYTGVMPGVFATVAPGSHTVTPDSQGRVPLQFPFRYQHHCHNQAARYTRFCQPLQSQQASFSFPHYADSEFIIAFEQGDLNRPIICGTAANDQSGHIHSDTHQHRSGYCLPQGQQWLFTNTLGNNNSLKLGVTHQEGQHQSFLMLNNINTPGNDQQKYLDFIQATTANAKHHITEKITEQFAGKPLGIQKQKRS